MMEINGKTRICGLIGNPVEHTLSPIIHNYLAKELKENLVYVPFHVKNNFVKDAVHGLHALNILGCNVTVPYKTEVIAYLDEIDDLAKEIGAVNTIVRSDKGLKGYNTDMPGLYRAMESDDIFIQDESFVILGAGGVARAVAIMLREYGAKEIVILNRNEEKAKELAKEVNKPLQKRICHAHSIKDYEKVLEGSYITIQATSVGMYPNVDEAIIEEESFYKYVKVGYDLIFNPAETKFMKFVKASGGIAFNGLKMLLYQGIIAYELWTRSKVNEAIARKVYNILNNSNNVVLIGFMGSGKSTIGKLLENELDFRLIDTDCAIESNEGQSISQLFETKGEQYFREQETKLLKELCVNCKENIISLGGGTPIIEMNQKLIRELGFVIFLRIKPETVIKRLKNDKSRPLLQGENPEEKIAELLLQRSSIYENLADIIIDVDELSILEILQKIITNLGGAHN